VPIGITTLDKCQTMDDVLYIFL